jgi:type II secretory pathway pseudopilin PulG
MKRQRHHGRGQRQRPSTGHSLPELLLVLLVLVLLAGLATPALQTWMLDLQLQTTLDELTRGLALARSEALATGRVVEFRYRPLPAGQRVTINRSAILFSPSGNATPATLTLCDRRRAGRSLIVARSGRVRAASGQCGFVLAEVLAGLLLLAVGALALAQALLQSRQTVANSTLQTMALDALSSANEGSRLLGNHATFPAEAEPLAATWRATYSGGGSSPTPSLDYSPTLALSWQPLSSGNTAAGASAGANTGVNNAASAGANNAASAMTSAGGWIVTAATGGLKLAMESHP